MKSLAYTTQLPELSPKLKELQWSVDHWKKYYSETGNLKERAWKEYYDAVDNNLSREVIDDLYATVKLFENVCTDAWKGLDEAKQQLLALYN